MTYVKVREVLKEYGVKGCTLNELSEKTELPTNELYQIIKRGFKVGGIESYKVNGVRVYRNRLPREQLYGKREWQILKGK